MRYFVRHMGYLEARAFPHGMDQKGNELVRVWLRWVGAMG